MSTPEENKEFPGYPTYPAKDDITSKETRESLDTQNDMDIDAQGDAAVEQRAVGMPKPKNAEDAEDKADDVTGEDIEMLSASDQNRDMNDLDEEEPVLDMTDNDGDPLNERAGRYGKAGADLDVPGSEADDADENIGEEDEENNYYSLGGDKDS
ncbi:MAG: hypothetical protein ABI378_05215 [Chitinophagaceae bacterium]